MKVRLIGPAVELDALIELLTTIAVVDAEAKEYPGRDRAHPDWVRRYLRVSLFGEAEDPDPYAIRCPWCRLPHVCDPHGPAMGGESYSCRRCRRLYIAAGDMLTYLAPAVDVATVQPGDWVLLPVGWRVVLDVRVTDTEVEIRTDVPTDPLTGFRLPRVLTRREVKPWHDGSTYTHLVHVVRDGQEGLDL
jgi:hypothetical protein